MTVSITLNRNINTYIVVRKLVCDLKKINLNSFLIWTQRLEQISLP